MASADDDGFGYWAALNQAWGSPDVIVNVEHDMEYSDELEQELLDCPHTLCTHAYRMHHIATLPKGFWAHMTAGPAIDWVSPGVEWASWSALGFCKIAPEVRGVPIARASWQVLEQEVNVALRACMRPLRWHVHWPGVEHYHYADRP